jgi:hypothetical protein
MKRLDAVCADHGRSDRKICGDFGILVVHDHVVPDTIVGLTGLPGNFVDMGRRRLIVDLRAARRTDSEELRQIVGLYIAEQKTRKASSIARPRKNIKEPLPNHESR